MSGLPPPPYYTRPQVIPSSEYVQRSPFEKQDLYSEYQTQMGRDSFWQNSRTPNSAFYISTLGRSVLPDLSVSQEFARAYGSQTPIDADLQRALWTAQVLTFWLTDGFAYRRYDGMQGLVSRMGLDPQNPSLVLDENGFAITDLRSLLNPTTDKESIFFVKGPDSLFGPEMESVIEEYAGTRKLFGKAVPEKSKPILENLITKFPTTKIRTANTLYLAGKPRASRVEPVETPCNMLLEDARLARKDCRGDSPKTVSSGNNTPPPQSTTDVQSKNSPKNQFAQTESNSNLKYFGIAGLIFAIATAGYLYSRNKNKKDM